MLNRLKIYIDVANINNRFKDCDIQYKKIDYIKFINKLSFGYDYKGTNYYITPFKSSSINQNWQRNFKNQQKYFSFLKLNIPNFTIKQFEAKPRKETPGKFQEKGVDMEIGLDMVIDATKSSVDTLMLLSAERDFIPSIERVKEFGKEVIIAYLIIKLQEI